MRCPHCLQLIKYNWRWRFGVAVTGFDAEIIDKIVEHPGVTIGELAKMLGRSKHTLRHHITNIRKRLKPTDVRLLGRHYAFVKSGNFVGNCNIKSASFKIGHVR